MYKKVYPPVIYAVNRKYQARVIQPNGQWQQEYGRRIGNGTMMVKDYSKTSMFVNPLSPTQGIVLGMHQDNPHKLLFRSTSNQKTSAE
jgi:hypothetical protein